MNLKKNALPQSVPEKVNTRFTLCQYEFNCKDNSELIAATPMLDPPKRGCVHSLCTNVKWIPRKSPGKLPGSGGKGEPAFTARRA
jgi:hypothetical protein